MPGPISILRHLTYCDSFLEWCRGMFNVWRDDWPWTKSVLKLVNFPWWFPTVYSTSLSLSKLKTNFNSLSLHFLLLFSLWHIKSILQHCSRLVMEINFTSHRLVYRQLAGNAVCVLFVVNIPIYLLRQSSVFPKPSRFCHRKQSPDAMQQIRFLIAWFIKRLPSGGGPVTPTTNDLRISDFALWSCMPLGASESVVSDHVGL